MSMFSMHDARLQNAFTNTQGGFAQELLGFADRWGAGINAGMKAGTGMLGQIEAANRSAVSAAMSECLSKTGDENYCKKVFEQAAGRTSPATAQLGLASNTSMPATNYAFVPQTGSTLSGGTGLSLQGSGLGMRYDW